MRNIQDSCGLILENKYSKWYFNIIERAKKSDRKRRNKNHSEYIYYEKHHIIPDCFYISNKAFRNGKCLDSNGKLEGDPNSPENLVLLTAKEHFICHLLLWKATNGFQKTQMAFAANRLRTSNKANLVNGRKYEALRKAVRENSAAVMKDRFSTKESRIEHGKKKREYYKENPAARIILSEYGKSRTGDRNPNYGKQHSVETKMKIGLASKLRMQGENHPGYGKPSPIKGQKRTTEQKQRMSCAAKLRWAQRKKSNYTIKRDEFGKFA